MGYLGGRLGPCGQGVFVHELGQEVLVQAAPVDADAHWFRVAQRHLDHGRELFIALVAKAHVAGVDAVLVQGLGARRVPGQECMAVIMKVADQGDLDAHSLQPVPDIGDRTRRLFPVDGEADHL